MDCDGGVITGLWDDALQRLRLEFIPNVDYGGVGLTRIPFDWAWYKTNSLWTGVAGHIIFDLLAFLVGAMAG